ncbi:hypothetical protein A4A49_42435 [Nicotiana attenuata]|uniref:Uncharacterized protein n=1 Tax=Nicotiana attenuata TaxID=49451 RepID=A0A1J6J918_NICAT|nr:hypothetical protein A4A49_61572 [Nicotiana attenuata]OIT19100.1 hypothetical protein A4A49_42435 [Nicotiana attenuata]
MKHHHFPAGDNSLINESKETMREKLWGACESAITTAINSKQTCKELGTTAAEFYNICSKKQRRKISNLEDPMRTIMFVGSWSHT